MFLLRRGIIRNFSNVAKFPARREAFLNEVTSCRDPAGSVLGVLFDTKYTDNPDIIYLAGGLPNPFLFPFKCASFKLRNNRVVKIDEELMLKGLQYGCIEGYGPLVAKLKSYMTRFHNVTDWKARDLVVCGGSTDALSRCLEMILGNDVYFLAEEALFGSVTSYIETYMSRYIRIEKDEFGLKPQSLRNAVLNILDKEPKTKKLVLYFNYMTVKRSSKAELAERLENIYKIAQEFDILIIEIDPHFLLHLKKEDEKDFPSLLRLDIDERVLRCDTTSILFGPGLRIGTVTGPHPFMRLICSHIDGSMLHASQLSQVLISKAIEESGDEDLQEYSRSIYESMLSETRDLETAAKAFLGKRNWNLYPEFPFIWFKVEKTPELVKFLEDEESQIKFALSPYSLASEETYVTIGLSLIGTSLEQKEKACCEISKFLTSYTQ